MGASRTDSAVAGSPPPQGRVAAVWTTPETVRADYRRVMRLAEYRSCVSPERETALRTCLSRSACFLGASTAPWQLDGVVRTLLADGFDRDRVYACHDALGAADPVACARAHHLHRNIADVHGLGEVHLWEQAWTRVRPPAKLARLYDLCPEGVDVPTRLLGQNTVHLPTLQTDARWLVAGAMLTAARGLLRRRPHWPPDARHTGLVDLLVVHRQVHAGTFAVTDGTVAGDGAGPGGLRPQVKNLLLASGDLVALDAVAAKLMGLEPLGVPSIRQAHERGLGVGRFEDIQVLGDDIAGVNFRFALGRGAGVRATWWPAAALLDSVRTLVAPAAGWLRRWCRDRVWHPLIGAQRVQETMDTAWGRLFQEYA